MHNQQIIATGFGLIFATIGIVSIIKLIRQWNRIGSPTLNILLLLFLIIVTALGGFIIQRTLSS